MRIVYFGSPDLSVPFLSALVQEPDFDVVGVVTQPEKPVGRKAVMTKSAVHEFALAHSIPVFPFQSLKTQEAAHELAKLQADVFVVVVYGKIIPKTILEIPTFGCLNVHPSLLPHYRGPSPFQYAILEGQKETGISIMLLDEGMDTGPVLAKKTFFLDDRETSETIQPKIITVGVPLLIETLHKWTKSEIQAIPQDNTAATYSKILSKQDAQIDWSKSAVEIDRQVRAFMPWPGTFFSWNENGARTRVMVHETAVHGNTPFYAPGTVLVEDNHVFIVCGDHTKLELVRIQPEGKQKMSPNDYIRGHQSFLETNLISD